MKSAINETSSDEPALPSKLITIVSNAVYGAIRAAGLAGP
jgi:hypothetical protein